MRKSNRKELLLYLSRANHPANISVASTMAWLSKSKNMLFDNYYDSYHQGIHFPGGDSRNLDMGQLSGGTVCGDRHFEEFYFLIQNFDVSILSPENSIFLSCIHNLEIPILSLSEPISLLYKKIFRHAEVPLPDDIVMLGSHFQGALIGLEAYLYPEIYYRKAIGVPDIVSEEDLNELYHEGSSIFCVYVDESVVTRLQTKGYRVEVVDHLNEDDDYSTVTARIAFRWIDSAQGWILGDPMLVSHWLPKACEENLLAIYSVPQEKIISQLSHLIHSKGKVVYGRQYGDRDFFELSKQNQCLQVIDPCRPPFQSVKHIDYTWHMTQNGDGFYRPEFTDETLRQFALEGKVLVSLMFWSGMIREIANFYNLMDLFTITGLRCGLVLTAQSYDYMMHSPLELLTIPLERGGVYPLIEPVLGSCGIGVGIESYIEKKTLQQVINEALSRISLKVGKKGFVPKGWWTTMDSDLVKLTWHEGPKPIRFLRYNPYFQVRFHAADKRYDESSSHSEVNNTKSMVQYVTGRLKEAIRNAGLMKYFEAYRPYEFYRPGPLRNDVMETAQATGLEYMFTKAGFNDKPRIKYLSDNFIALNYTSGQWDGWTPFETINDVSDLRKSEKKLLRSKKPGWIVSTIDSCLWTFGGEFWKRGNRLLEIAQFCTNGGRSGQLINVKPFTVARYARIIADKYTDRS